jgi:hypothetical protein
MKEKALIKIESLIAVKQRDLDIHLNEVQIDEIKSLLTNNEF